MTLQKIWSTAGLVLLLVIYFIIRCNYLDAVPRWDAGSYWSALTTAVNATLNMASWTQLPRIILDSYNAFGHPSMGYYSILVLGQLYDFPNLFMLNMTNILLAILSIFSVYKILRWFFPEARFQAEVLVATAAYAMEPLFFGCSIYLNTDFPVLVFLTVSLACLLYGHFGLFAIASLFLVFSKEPGVMFWAATMGGIGLYSGWILLQNWRTGVRPTLASLLPPFHRDQVPVWRSLYRILCLLIPGIAFKLFMVAQKGAMWVGGTGIKFDSNGVNCFGFNPRVMSNRAGEMFVLDFHWVPALVILVTLLVGIGRIIERRQAAPTFTITEEKNTDCHVPANRIWGMFPIVSCFFALVAFNLLYITYIIPRYVVPIAFFLVLFTFFTLHLAVRSRKIRLSILGVILVLFTWQTFRTVDPLSKLAFGTASFGEHKILQIDSPGEAVGNGFVYNTEFTAPDKLFNLMQKAIPMTADTQLIAWNKDSWYPWFSMGTAFVDSVTLERTVDWRNSFVYKIMDIDEIYSQALPATAVYFYMPWLAVFSNEQAELDKLRTFYHIAEAEEVGFQGYNLRFYRLTRLSQ